MTTHRQGKKDANVQRLYICAHVCIYHIFYLYIMYTYEYNKTCMLMLYMFEVWKISINWKVKKNGNMHTYWIYSPMRTEEIKNSCIWFHWI